MVVYPLQIQHVPLPDGLFELFIPIPERVGEVYKSLQLQNPDTPFPYWARLWPSAIALASYLQKNAPLINGRWVAELAAGIGLPSLVAAGYAKKVWCSDWVAEATQVAVSYTHLDVYKRQT